MSSLDNTLFFVQQQLIRYIYPIYLIFGVTGCCLNILLLTRRRFRKVSCCLYFTIVSAAMLVTLPFGTGPFIYSLDHPNPFTTIVSFCKIRSYILQVSSMTYRWCLVIATIDQYTLTSANARLRNFAKVRVAYRVIPIIIIVWLIFPVHCLIFFNVGSGRCAVIDNIRVTFYHAIYTIITGCVLPVSIMIVCAILIRHNLVLKRERRRQLTSNPQNINENMQLRLDQQVFAMLSLQILVYLVTQTAYITFWFYTTATIYISNKSSDRQAIERFISFITESMVYLFPVLSFYLYTLASRTFRKELMRLLRCASRHRQVSDVNHNNTLAINGPVQTQAYPGSKFTNKQEQLTSNRQNLHNNETF